MTDANTPVGVMKALVATRVAAHDDVEDGQWFRTNSSVDEIDNRY